MSSEKNRKIAKNTLVLYFRMLFSMGVSLFTSRIVLNTLGVTDFGVYNVVGGLVTAFTLISGSLSAASQRFISFELGKKENHNLRGVFSTTIIVHMFLAIIVLILSETIGLWFLNTHMNIDAARMPSANWVYQFSLISFLIALISTPYNAAIIAYEKMKTFAYIGIGEVVLKLIFVLLLPFFPFDKLVTFSFMIMVIAVLQRLLYGFYCNKYLKDCVFAFVWNRKLFKDIASFAGWNLIGVSSSVLMTQGTSILLNLFFGVVVNAAQGVARQVQQSITGFITNFMTALNPQITKSYASKDHDYMMKLMFQGARYSFYLMFILSLPILVETEQILKLWLKIIPDNAVIFVRLTLILAITQTLSQTLITGMNATGNIKWYQIVVGGLQMLNFPLSYLFLKLKFPPQSTIVIAIIMSYVCLATRLIMFHRVIKFPISNYLSRVVLKTSLVAVLSSVVPFLLLNTMAEGIVRLLFLLLVSFLSALLVTYIVGISTSERSIIHRKFVELRIKYGFV